MNAFFSNWKTLVEVAGLVVTGFGISLYPATISPEKAVRSTAKIRSIITGPDSTRFLSKGSGVFVSSDGLLLTSYHNIAGALSIETELADGQRTTARLVAGDPRTDLALLKIETRGQAWVRLAQADQIQVGQHVYAVGSTGCLDFSFTDGLVGGLDRQIGAILSSQRIEQFVQTNVPLNPGCSGGPLLNANGELVGINTAIWSATGRFEGYSFAVPVSLIRGFLQKYNFEKS